LQQALEVDLAPGAFTLSAAPVPPWQGGWQGDAPLKTLRVEAVE